MKWTLKLAALGEMVTGLVLLIAPQLVVSLLLGEHIDATSEPLARVLGIALIALGFACWPEPARLGMLVYGAAIALYLAYAALVEGMVGVLLWPAVVLHVILVALLVWLNNDATGLRGKRI